MKFKLNITKTGLPDGEIIVGDWYEGNDPILTWNPLMILNGRNGEKRTKTGYVPCFFFTRLREGVCFEEIQLDICLWLYLEWYL